MSDVFNALVAELEYPMFIVTTAADRERSGCLVGFAAQCSIDPSRFMVWLSKSNRTFRVASRADVLAVHLVSKDDMELATLFGGETGDEVDKFARCRWREGPSGVPVLEDLPRWFAGRVLDRQDGGDHMGFLLAPEGGSTGEWSGQLGFQQAKSIDAAKEA